MNCEEVQERLLEGADASEDAAIATHLAGCVTCRAVADARGGIELDGGDFAALFAAVEAEQRRERGPLAWLRSRPTWVRRSMIFGMAIVIATIILVAMRRPDFAFYPMGRFALELGLLAGALAVAVAVAVRPRLDVPSARATSALVGLAILVPVLLAVLPQAHAGHPASLLGVGSDFLPRAIGCLVWGLVMGTPTAIIAFLARRDGGGEPRRDLLLAGAAGLAGVIALEMHCPITDGDHLLVGHVSVVVILVAVIAVAGWLGGRLRRRRG
ncbi:MAG: hypothetical protein CVU56_02870 [Deltaproteobacteria bacterium HGW-Deltaproteobacteria-14]|jgi:predicted anti-sigma-YlaC factor YlaD|nr:MAG: hypothetical protein CVU56_02870 [Deltaproteobacteria bacterium HGW-Deltaproteobacteria-14]